MQKYLNLIYYSHIYFYKNNIQVYIFGLFNNLNIFIINYKTIYKLI